jgi:hypothetical protein
MQLSISPSHRSAVNAEPTAHPLTAWPPESSRRESRILAARIRLASLMAGTALDSGACGLLRSGGLHRRWG